MKKQFSKEEKAEYFKSLRTRWKEVSESVTPELKTQIEAVMRERGLEFSPISWVLIQRQMENLGFDGIPYVDAKTFKGWQDAGFRVRKGEKSKMIGITWVGKEKEDDSEKKHVFPKAYHLFHKSQVQEIAA